jgi:hypothetical protein
MVSLEDHTMKTRFETEGARQILEQLRKMGVIKFPAEHAKTREDEKSG